MRPTLYGVIAYENVSVAKIAKEKWDYLVHTLKDGVDFELRLWKFDILQIPEWRDAAINDATQAQLVFVATRGAGDLPPEVKEWIEEWLVLKGRVPHTTRLLSAVFDPSSNGPGASLFHSSLTCNRRPGGDRWISLPPARPLKTSRAPLDSTPQPQPRLRGEIRAQDAITPQSRR
jgi:hypothetical protein